MVQDISHCLLLTVGESKEIRTAQGKRITGHADFHVSNEHLQFLADLRG